MSNHLFGYARGGYGGGEAGTSNLYSSRSVANTGESSFLGTSSRYLSLDSITPSSISSSLLYVPENYSVRIPGIGTPANSYDPPGVDLDSTVASIDSRHSGWKRNTSELPYEPTILGAQIKIGQTEAWYSTDLIDKRPRYESTSHLPIYPQRPGEKDCEFYMQTRTCKFGDSCKFHHPIWVPEGGAPNWKEVPVAPVESLPERPGEPDCPYFLKTKRCKFGSRCKFNHPKDLVVSQGELEDYHSTFLPERPSEPQCAFYMKTGKCKFGATCKFDHPKGVHPQSDGDESGTPVQYQVAGNTKLVDPSVAPALMHNSKGLPIRLGEEDCPFYLKTGSCKYGATCRFNHPDRYAAVTPSHLTSPSTHLSIGFPTASLLSNFDPRLTQTTANLLGLMPTAYPQRPGQSECDYYMKTGSCKYGSSCKFHHPLDRSARSASTTGYQMENVKLTLAGLPRREGAIHCPFYMKTGLCKYGATCKFDHPPRERW